MLHLAERCPPHGEAVAPSSRLLACGMKCLLFPHSLFDLPSDWYLKTRHSVQQFTICQIGECPFQPFARSPWRRYLCCLCVSCGWNSLDPFWSDWLWFGMRVWFLPVFCLWASHCATKQKPSVAALFSCLSLSTWRSLYRLSRKNVYDFCLQKSYILYILYLITR